MGGGSDEDISRLANKRGERIIDEIAKLIAAKNNEVGAAPTEVKSTVSDHASTRTSVEALEVTVYKLRQQLRPDGTRKILLGEFTVDYDEPLKKKIAACEFDGFSEYITAKHFPFNQKGKKTVTLSLVSHGHKGSIHTHGVEGIIQRLEGTSADLVCELEVAKLLPNLQLELCIIALGSLWQTFNGNVLVPALRRNGNRRRLSFRSFSRMWHSGYWFLIEEPAT